MQNTLGVELPLGRSSFRVGPVQEWECLNHYSSDLQPVRSAGIYLFHHTHRDNIRDGLRINQYPSTEPGQLQLHPRGLTSLSQPLD